MASEAIEPHSGHSQSIGARVLVAGPAHPGLAAALDALHGGAEGPVEMLAADGGCEAQASAWAWSKGDQIISGSRATCWAGAPELIQRGWPTLVLTTPGDTSGAAAMAREAGIPVREVGT
jgi:hypothetical protein